MSFLSGSHVQQPGMAGHHGGGGGSSSSSLGGYPPASAGHPPSNPSAAAATRPASPPPCLPAAPCRTPPPPSAPAAPPSAWHPETPRQDQTAAAAAQRSSPEVKVGPDAAAGPQITLTGGEWSPGPGGKEGPSGSSGPWGAPRPGTGPGALKMEGAGLGGGAGGVGGCRGGGSGLGLGVGGAGLSLGSAGQSPSSPRSFSSSSPFSPSPSGPSPDTWPGTPLLPSQGLFLAAGPQKPLASGPSLGPPNQDPTSGHPSLGSPGFQNTDGTPAGLGGPVRTEPAGREAEGPAAPGRCQSGTEAPPRELPQRSTVRRAMSDCSHLAVPSMVAESYPSPGNASGSPGSLGSAATRPHPPHAAVRRSFTVSDERAPGGVSMAMASMMPFQLTAGPAAMPSSPPPRRHDGSCETSVLLPVPPSVVPPVNGFHSNWPNMAVFVTRKQARKPQMACPWRKRSQCNQGHRGHTGAIQGPTESLSHLGEFQHPPNITTPMYVAHTISTSHHQPNPRKPDNKDKQEKVDDKKEKEKEVPKQELQDKGLKSEKILKEEEAVKAEKSLLDRNEKMGEKIGEKKDKPEKTNKDEKEEEKKKGEEKKVEKEEKGGKAVAKSPTAAKGLPSPNGKNKPDVGSAKPNATKSRPSTLSTNGEASSAKRPSPTTASANKKSPGAKATTPTAAKKAAKTPDNSTAEKRPAVPKATPTPRASVNKPASPGNKVDKPEGKAADTKKAATPKTTAPGPSPSPAQGAAAASNGELSHRRRTLTKPPVPKQTPVDKKAAAAPRPPRTPRPLNTPTPDLKNIRSKIGSTDNIKYQPGGGKVTQNSKTSDSSTPAAKPRVQQILNRKVDLSKVTSKCGSKDNIKYKPGGGDVKIESHKMSIKAKSKIGSLDNVGLELPSSGATNGHKEKAENKAATSPSTAPTTGPGSVAKAGAAPGGVAKENGVKEPMPSTPFGGDGLNQPLIMNKQMTGTN
ncbi:unnamed protein product [Boreogadus saida]